MGWPLAVSACLVVATPAHAEKPPIDGSVYGKWPTAEFGSISNDGGYVSWNDAVGNSVISSTHGSWHVEVARAYSVGFSEDGRKAVIMKADHSLDILTLGSSHADTRLHVESARLAFEGSHRWLVYRGLAPDRALHVMDLTTAAERSIPSVEDFQFASKGRALVVQTGSESDSPVHTLRWINLADGASTPFWEGSAPRNIVVSKMTDQVAFLAVDAGASPTGDSVWYYKAGMEQAQ